MPGLHPPTGPVPGHMALRLRRELDPRYRIGYDAARHDLRRLLAKVDEKKRLGVVYAWLHEQEEDENERK